MNSLVGTSDAKNWGIYKLNNHKLEANRKKTSISVQKNMAGWNGRRSWYYGSARIEMNTSKLREVGG